MKEAEVYGEYDKQAIPNRMVAYIDRPHRKKITLVFRDGIIWKTEEPLGDEIEKG